MIRAAESIPTNIIEGCGASTPKEFARFLDIGIKSNMELEYQLQLSRDNGVLGLPDWRALTAQTIEVRRTLCGLRAKEKAAAQRESDCRSPSVTEQTDGRTTANSQLAVSPAKDPELPAELHPQPEAQR